jgi:ATP-dependent DNA helicase RecQ
MTPKEVLKRYFGYDNFRHGQEEIIETIISGQDCVVILPTGGGKSLCYQIPALLSNNFSIVISPLIALMKDQVDSLNKNEKLAGFINSTMNFIEVEEVFNGIARKEIKLLYLAPEKLTNISFAERIKSLSPDYFFVDEAHCISEWGHNFRPSYSKIKEFTEYISIKRISAFTATATPEVIDDIVLQLGLTNSRIFIKGFERENLSINVIRTKRKKEKCLELINQCGTPAIIYASSRKRTEAIAEFLNLYGLNAAHYHAGLAPEERKHIQEFFLDDKIKIIAATTAFGMGIDKKDIRLVIHYNMPASIENYYQEIGRAGRDGLESNAYLLYEDRDRDIHNYFLAASNPTAEIIKSVYNAICDYGKIAIGNMPDNEVPVIQDYISSYINKDISTGLIESCIRNLELSGYLKSVSELEKKHTIQFNLSQNKLKQFVKSTGNNLIKDVVLLLIREYGNSIITSKVQISLTNLAYKFETSEEYLDELLTQLFNSGIIEYSKPLLHRSVKLRIPRVEDRFINPDYKKIKQSFDTGIKKLDKIIEYVYSNDCRMNFIINYFGESEKDFKCNKCDNCADKTTNNKDNLEYLEELFLRTINEGKGEIPEQRLVNILRGKIGKEYSSYGHCANYSENELRSAIEELKSKNIIAKKTPGNRITIDKKGIEILNKLHIALIQDNKPVFNYEDNLELYNRLREIRNAAAVKFLQPNYLICTDEILKMVTDAKPITSQQIFAIKGFNQRMFNKVGNDFLEVITEYLNEKKDSTQKERDVPSIISETFNLITKGYNLDEISSLRKLSKTVISMQVETILEYKPKTDISNLIDKNKFDPVMTEIQKGFADLKDLKSRLPDNIDYAEIRIILAYKRINGI